MNNLIWVNEQDEVVGYGEKIYTHQKEQLHRAFSLFIIDQEGRMLLQLRAKNKYHSGGLWSNACCSHPYQDEKWCDALMRCMDDELGTHVTLKDFVLQDQIFDNLYFCGKFIYYSKYENLSEHEYDHVFVLYVDDRFKENISLNPEEIEKIEWVSKEELENRLVEEKNFTSWFKKAYKLAKKMY